MTDAATPSPHLGARGTADADLDSREVLALAVPGQDRSHAVVAAVAALLPQPHGPEGNVEVVVHDETVAQLRKEGLGRGSVTARCFGLGLAPSEEKRTGTADSPPRRASS